MKKHEMKHSVRKKHILIISSLFLLLFSAIPVNASVGTVLVGPDYYEEPSGQEGSSPETPAGIGSNADTETNSGTDSNADTETSSGTDSNAAAAEDAGSDLFDENEEDWCLILVNRDHPIPDDYEIPELTTLSGGHRVDSRIYPALQKMFDDARSQGIYPGITSSYRTFEDQQEQMDIKASEYTAAGYSKEDAYAMAEEWVAIPGTSEHQLGLCLDISSYEQDPGTVWYWLKMNAYRYGFIQRYPEEKSDITGINNEPWHYRYVGRRAALEMNESGMCLEEYLASRHMQ